MPNDRNRALDYIRVLGLCLMLCVHVWREVPGGGSALENALLFTGELAPAFFFVAFGMTQRRFVVKPISYVLYFFLLFGYVALLQSELARISIVWEFFLFLWVSAALTYMLARAGLTPAGFWTVSLVIVLVNYVVYLEGLMSRPWLPTGSFYPLPWVVCVFAGYAYGMDIPSTPRALATLILGAAMAAFAVLTYGYRDALTHALPALKLGMDKFHMTGSNYIVVSVSAALVVYVLLDYLSPFLSRAGWLDRWVKFMSLYLIEGVILHYLVRFYTLKAISWYDSRDLLGAGPLSLPAVALMAPLYIAFLSALTFLAVSFWAWLAGRLEFLTSGGWAVAAVFGAGAAVTVALGYYSGGWYVRRLAYYQLVALGLELRYIRPAWAISGGRRSTT